MNMQYLLKLLEQKYPAKHSEGMNPAILIYNDESGRIVKNALNSAYEPDRSNSLYEFYSLEELYKHLQPETQLELFPRESE